MNNQQKTANMISARANNSIFEQLNNESSKKELDTPETECSWVNCDDEELTNDSSFIYEPSRETPPTDGIKELEPESCKNKSVQELSPAMPHKTNKVREEIIEALKVYESRQSNFNEKEERNSPVSFTQANRTFPQSSLVRRFVTDSNKLFQDKNATVLFNKTQRHQLWFNSTTAEEETEARLSEMLVEELFTCQLTSEQANSSNVSFSGSTLPNQPGLSVQDPYKKYKVFIGCSLVVILGAWCYNKDILSTRQNIRVL